MQNTTNHNQLTPTEDLLFQLSLKFINQHSENYHEKVLKKTWDALFFQFYNQWMRDPSKIYSLWIEKYMNLSDAQEMRDIYECLTWAGAIAEHFYKKQKRGIGG
jgi:hypothetical protein